MQLAGTTSWQIGTDEPQLLLMALYMRGASGLRSQVDPDIPPLEPPMPFDDMDSGKGRNSLPGETPDKRLMTLWR
jgi:hypothetical protein